MRLVIAALGTAVLAFGCDNGNMTNPPATTIEADMAAGTVEEAVSEAPVAQASAAPAAARQPAQTTRPAAPRAPAASPAPAPAPAPRAAEAPPAPAPALPQYREIVVPAGTMLALRLTSAVASDTSQVEDVVRATLRSTLTLEDGVVLPAGAELIGHVTDTERAGRVRGRARVAFRFTSMRYDGDEYDIRTDTIERVAEATKSEDATKIGVGAGAGAALGALLGGGSGAAKGAAIGAAAGTGAVLATRGQEVRLEPGEPVDATLTAPLMFRTRMY
jgi:hypothetical protein